MITLLTPYLSVCVCVQEPETDRHVPGVLKSGGHLALLDRRG